MNWKINRTCILLSLWALYYIRLFSMQFHSIYYWWVFGQNDILVILNFNNLFCTYTNSGVPGSSAQRRFWGYFGHLQWTFIILPLIHNVSWRIYINEKLVTHHKISNIACTWLKSTFYWSWNFRLCHQISSNESFLQNLKMDMGKVTWLWN